MTEALLERLRSGDPDDRRAACREAVDEPESEELLDALSALLGDPARAVARTASDSLAKLGRTQRGVDRSLTAALRSDDPRRRFGAAFTLARLAPPTPRLLPALVEALSLADGDVRWAAAKLLVEAGRLHGEVLPLLLGLARAGADPRQRRMASYCLRELAPDRPEAARVLLQATLDEDLRVRRAAFTALAGLIDPPAEVGVRLVEALAGDADGAVRRIAAVALGEIGAADWQRLPREAVDALRKVRDESRDGDLQRAARRALSRLELGRDR